MAVTTIDYVPEAGKVMVDEKNGHPGIKATTFSYGQINDDMLGMLEKPHPSYFLLLLGFLLALLLGVVSLSIQERRYSARYTTLSDKTLATSSIVD